MSTRTYLTGMAATMVVLLMIGVTGLAAVGQANNNPRNLWQARGEFPAVRALVKRAALRDGSKVIRKAARSVTNGSLCSELEAD
jgi:hypothetical protein